MRKLKLFLSLLMVMLLSVGNVWAAEQVAYTLAPATGSNNSYAGNCDVTISGITWNVTGNATLTPWRLGGKSLSGVNRTVYSKTAMSDAITKVELTVGAASSINVNSLKLVVASNSDFSTVIDEVTETFATNSTITFEPTSPATQWAGAYYKFVFNVSVSGNNNKYVEFKSAKFYKEVATAICETPTFSPAAGTFFGEQEITLATSTAGASIYYTTDGTTPSSSNGTLYEDPFSIDETTTIKAIAVKAGASDSEVAEATYTAGTPVSTFDIDFETNNLAAYVNWNFVNIASTTTTITAYAGTYYGKTSGTATASITTKAKYANPGILTFYTSKESGNTTASSWIAQVSEDGEVWTEVATFDATTGNKGTWTEREANLSGHTDVYVRIAYSGSTAIRAIDNISLATASEVAKPAISGDENFLTSTEVSIACSTGGVTIYYTNDGTDPKTSDTKQTYSDPFSINATTTIRAIANLGAAWSAEATSKTFTKITPITVAAAIAAIPNKDDVVNDQYVSGIVCTAGTSVSSGKMTYYISDDGSETNRLQIYKGKNVGNTNFTAATDLAIGDRVVVFGQLKNYNNTPEMNDGNYLVSKATPAVAAPEFTPNGGGFMGETDVTITCETVGSAIYYTLDGTTTPTKLSTPYEAAIHLDATTTIKAIAYVGDDASLVITKTFTLTAPMTVADALTALDTEDPINNVAVAGIISTAPTSNPSSGKLTYYISDDGTDTDELEVFLGFGLNGASFSAKTDLQVGDEVTVFGNLTIFNSTTKEFASGSRLLAFNRPQVDVESISLTESTAEVEEGKTVTLHASVVPANATNKTIVWSVQSGNDKAEVDANGVVTGIAAGEAVVRAAAAADENIYAECTVTVTEPAPLSPWASVYTSNVTLSIEGGTSASAAKVKFHGEEGDGYDAIKAGTGSVQGAVVVNVPAGATALHFHAYSWYNETVELTVTAPTGVTVTPSEAIAINKNSGISGSSSTYTLAEGSDPKMDAYYAVSLSGNTEPVALTISATSGKRFVLFGVNQEGGLVLESIAISGTASVLEYNDGDNFDPAGLVVMGHYSNGSDAPISEGIDWTFDPDPLTEGTTSVSVTATVGEISSIAFVVDGLTVHGAAPLSPWASVYTSNVTLSTEGGTSASAAKVKFYGEEGDGYDAIKAGTSSAQGAVVVNVPAGATALHFHTYSWYNETVELTVTAPTGVTVTPSEAIAINKNSGISGSSSTYTLAEGSDPKTDAYYAVSLSGNTEPVALTISATSGKRFVLFGVNQEGGIVPELQSIEIAGDLTTKSYKAGDALDLDGLTVNAIYSLGGTPQTPVDITDDAELEWSYAPLVENQTSITITATYKGQTDDIAINDLVVTSADPKIYVSTLNVNFASVEVGESVPAAQTVTVNLTNIASVTATLGGTNPEAFSISKTEGVVDGDEITISILANTDAAASYSATLTISDGEGGADDKTINLSFAVTEPVVEDDVTGTWTLVTNATTLAAGKKVIIAQYVEADGAINTMAGQASNNRSVIASTVAGATLTPTVGTKVMTLADAGEGHFYLKTSEGEYLYNASGTKSYLRTKATSDDASWTIEVDADGVATITAVENTTRPIMRYNPNTSGSPLFNCYASGQEDIALYMLEEDTPEPIPDYTRNVTSGNYGTICLPKAGTIEGATLFEIAYYDETAKKIYLDEVTDGAMVAGRPYIFLATATELNVTYTSGDVVTTAGNYHGLYGFYDLNDENATTGNLTQDAGNYILYQNAYWLVKDRDAYVANYRAYIKLGVEGGAPTSAQAPAPGRRRVAMNVNGEQTATGINELNAAEAPVKMIIDGQLYILRGEKLYDATGRLVK